MPARSHTKVSPRPPPGRARQALLAVLGFYAGAQGAGLPPQKIDFNFEVRPVLAEHCYKCHGPDAGARKANLRLDAAENAYALGPDGKRAVVPRRPEQSELYRRITTTDPEDRMPRGSTPGLTPTEKQLLRQWIAEGAEYRPHWAFIPVGDTPVPKPVALRATTRNPIDAFVLARLDREGLRFSKEASRETLIRRLSFDLRGLPPSLAEIDAFLHDSSAAAYESLVDRLLASPAYGERQALDWLDLARYADTYGYQNDVERDMSPWRDWVIRAFNQNLPYDQFITCQLAGDLLPSATAEQILATAFNRLHRQTNEGGSVEEEFRNEYVADRVATAGTAFLGLTLGCARCHDHKFDPISQKDFYRMAAFFNRIDESGLYSHFTRATPGPTLLLYAPGEQARHRELQELIREQEAAVARAGAAASPRFEAWLRSAPRTIPVPRPAAAYEFEHVTGGATPDSAGTNRAALVDDPARVPGKFGQALAFSGDNLVVCRGVGAFNRTRPFSFSLWLRPEEKQQRAVIFHRSRAWTDSGSRGYELLLEEGRPSFGLIHFWPGNALRVRARTALPLHEWSHLAVTYDGSSRAAGVSLYLDGKPLELDIVRDHLFKDIVHREEWGDADVKEVQLTLAGRFRDSGFRNGALDEFRVFDYCLTAGEVQRLAGMDAAPGRAALRSWYLERVDTVYQSARAELQRLREQENQLVDSVPEIMVMRDMAQERPTYVLKRGAYDAPGERVEPGTPERILPFPAGLPRNRLGLARWVVDPRNPLTARVVVNRAWRSHFGRGLVLTEDDFGTRGKLPVYPALLDWLAKHFVTNGWDLKALHKLIVMSATYRQSSQASPELRARDPENELLARGPRHRLRAEEIRDNALAVSGLLSPRVGGPSVRPYQPEGLWEQAGTGQHYIQDTGEGLYRRSLYTFWKRTAPPPSMLVFDAPSREVCTACRETTTTPLQALVLMDDPQFVEAGRVLAERLLQRDPSDLHAAIVRGFRLATGRAPREQELQILRDLYQEQLQLFEAEPARAQRFLSVGERRPDAALPATALAAMSVLANCLMSLDEFVSER